MEKTDLSFFFIQILEQVVHDFNLFIQYIIIQFITPISILLGLYTLIVVLWCKKQTILRAWLLALTGMFAGPGLFFCMRMPGDGGDIKGLAAIIGINLFYSLLYIGNFLRKKYWPDNKICDKIRPILKKPCLRT